MPHSFPLTGCPRNAIKPPLDQETEMPQPIAVFDLDGTLVDTAPDLANSLNACLLGAGLAPSTLDDVRPHAGHGARLMLQHAYGRAGHPLMEDEMARQLAVFLAHYEAHIADLSRPLPGVVDAMDRLSAAGYVLAVCTNKTERLSIKLLDALGLSDRFAAICGADTFAGRKPDPRHLLGTIDRAGGGPAFLVGDTATDTDAAIAAAIPCALVDFGYAPDARARADAAVILSDYATLDAALADRLVGRRTDDRAR
jgi:phosphoglycolate phosphatase